MNRQRIDAWCVDLEIRGHVRTLFRHLAEKGQASMPDLLQAVYGDDPDGGPLYAEENIRIAIMKLRNKLAGRATVYRHSVYFFELNGAVTEDAPRIPLPGRQ